MQAFPIAVLLAVVGAAAAFAEVPGPTMPPGPATATSAAFAGASPGLLCRQAIAAAEQRYGIPDHLLAAIGRVESGRRDQETGLWHPWPWTIDAEGEGQFFATKAEAIAAVRSLQARGIRSIDVGCMQVNLAHHPDAFASLDQAFDPASNADYAARFLATLYQQTHSWTQAAAFYHSVTPELAAEYQGKVLAVWPEEQELRSFARLSPGALASSGPVAPVAHFGLMERLPMSHLSPAAGTAPARNGVGKDLAAYRAMPVTTAMVSVSPRSGFPIFAAHAAPFPAHPAPRWAFR